MRMAGPSVPKLDGLRLGLGSLLGRAASIEAMDMDWKTLVDIATALLILGAFVWTSHDQHKRRGKIERPDGRGDRRA